jgi:hypothetical protein
MCRKEIKMLKVWNRLYITFVLTKSTEGKNKMHCNWKFIQHREIIFTEHVKYPEKWYSNSMWNMLRNNFQTVHSKSSLHTQISPQLIMLFTYKNWNAQNQ